MRHEKHFRKHSNSGNWKNRKEEEQRLFTPRPVFRPTIVAVPSEQIRENEEKIREFKSRTFDVCPYCGEGIKDLSSALNDPESGKPVHFDCAHKKVVEAEKPGQSERIIYIGQGRFGLVYFANIHDIKHFQIKKIIEWDKRDESTQWRDGIANLYSHVR